MTCEFKYPWLTDVLSEVLKAKLGAVTNPGLLLRGISVELHDNGCTDELEFRPRRTVVRHCHTCSVIALYVNPMSVRQRLLLGAKLIESALTSCGTAYSGSKRIASSYGYKLPLHSSDVVAITSSTDPSVVAAVQADSFANHVRALFGYSCHLRFCGWSCCLCLICQHPCSSSGGRCDGMLRLHSY